MLHELPVPMIVVPRTRTREGTGDQTPEKEVQR
jgi:hypothetical protein